MHVKHAAPLAPINIRSIGDVAFDMTYSGMAHGVVVTGRRTGLEVNTDDLAEVRKSIREKLLLVGSGVTDDNITEIMKYADGAIIGTHFKENGVIENPVMKERVSRIIEKVR